MESYKRGSHTVWDCKYHLVWVTKYRYAVLGGDVGQRCRELLRETARAHEMVVHAGSINRDHVHLLLSIPPSLSVSRAVQYLKGRSSHKLLSEFATRTLALHSASRCSVLRNAEPSSIHERGAAWPHSDCRRGSGNGQRSGSWSGSMVW